MNYQMSLFNINLENKKADSSKLEIIAWNIQNASVVRARDQFKWIYDQNSDIIVLTEVKLSAGFTLLKAELEMQNYDVIFKESDSYFTVIAVRNYCYKSKELKINKFSERVNFIELETQIGKIALIGVYAPTCSADEKKVSDKLRFHFELYNEVINRIWKANSDIKIILMGDFNILEPEHKPKYLNFLNYFKCYEQFAREPFEDLYRHYNGEKNEYSWFGKEKYQRLDHVFATDNILRYIKKVEYLHEPRVNKLSDHSALHLEINI